MTSDLLGPVTLLLIPPDASAPGDRMWSARRIPSAVLEGVSTDAQDVLFQLDPRRIPSASLRIELKLPVGVEPPAILATLTHERWGEVIRERLPDGSRMLEWNGLPGGEVSLRLVSDGYVTAVRRGLQLEAGKRTEAERITLTAD